MRIFTRFLFLMLLPLFVCGQNPGYMGKKTIVGYGMHLSPVIFGSTAGNKTFLGKGGSAETGFIRVNYSHDLFAERAVATHWLLGLSLKYIYTGYDNRASLGVSDDKPTEFYTIRALTVNPYFKYYFGSYVAPWGYYFMIGPSVSRMTATYDEYMYSMQTVNNHDTLITDWGSDKTHFNADLLLGFGRNRIFKNRISLDYGFNFHLISALTTPEAFKSDLPVGHPSQQDYISETIRFRMRGVNRFNVFIKLGFLF